jgi:hypothetical protein
VLGGRPDALRVLVERSGLQVVSLVMRRSEVRLSMAGSTIAPACGCRPGSCGSPAERTELLISGHSRGHKLMHGSTTIALSGTSRAARHLSCRTSSCWRSRYGLDDSFWLPGCFANIARVAIT